MAKSKKKKDQHEYEKFKTEGIASMHRYMSMCDGMSDDEFKERVCKGLDPAIFLNELMFALFELKSMMLTNLKMVNEHMARQIDNQNRFLERGNVINERCDKG
jgi:hypothetical protein